MNTHDIDVELPPLPKGDIAADTCPVMWVHSAAQLQAYARTAIEADRKRRGEPVVEAVELLRVYLRLCKSLPRGDGSHLQRIENVIEALTNPQPAEPVKLECPKCGADRAKEPCAGNLMNCAFKGEAHVAEPVKEQP